jgi:hypothetical protein
MKPTMRSWRPPAKLRPLQGRRSFALGRSPQRAWPIIAAAVAGVAFVTVLVAVAIINHRHPAVGKWHSGAFSLTVDPDGIATVYGIVCPWKATSRNTIRIQPTTEIEIPYLGSIKLAFHLAVQEDGKTASLDAFGFPVMLTKDDLAP